MPVNTVLRVVPQLIESGAAAADIRVDVIDILNDFARHRQDGADLIYEAYDVDIGGY